MNRNRVPRAHARSARVPVLALLATAGALLALLFLSWTILASGRGSKRTLAEGVSVGAAETETPPPSAPQAVAPSPAPSMRTSVVEEEVEAAPTDAAVRAREDALDLTVAWDDGTPVAGALVAITVAEEVLTQGTTDPEGRLLLDPVLGEEPMLIVAQGTLEMLHLPLARRSGALFVEIPLAGAVRGTVRVAGAIPSEPVALILRTHHGQVGLGAIPRFVREQLDWRLRGNVVSRAKTDPDGRFTFGGLAPDWRGELIPSGGYVLSSGQASVPMDAPTVGLFVDLLAPPILSGRVLSPKGSPVPGASFRYDVKRRRGSSAFEHRTDTEGRFRIVLGSKDPEKATLRFRVPGIGRRIVETDLDPTIGKDLGDIVLEPVRSIEFLVTGPNGTPIEGAEVQWELTRCDPSGPDGRCTFESLPLEPITVKVRALAHLPVELEIPAVQGLTDIEIRSPEEDGPIVVVLRPATSLEVFFVDRAGRPVEGLSLVVAGTPLFANPEQASFADQSGLGASRISLAEFPAPSQGTACVKVVYESRISNRVFGSVLMPNVSLDLEALDASGAPTGWKESVVLAEAETTTIEAVIPRPAHFLEGRVADPDGSPIIGASLSMSEDDTGPLTTDENGRFKFGPLVLETTPLSVTAPGYAPLHLPEAPVGTSLEIQLEPGRTHFVRVSDAEGTPYRPATVIARRGDSTLMEGVEQPDGRFLFEHLPTDPIEIIAFFGGATFPVFASDGDQTRITVPAPGRLVVHWSPDPRPGETCAVSVRSKDDPSRRDWRPLGSDELEAGEIRFETLLPGEYFVDGFVAVSNDGSPSTAFSTEVEILARETVEVQADP